MTGPDVVWAWQCMIRLGKTRLCNTNWYIAHTIPSSMISGKSLLPSSKQLLHGP